MSQFTYRVEKEGHFVRVIIRENDCITDVWEGVDSKKMLRRLSKIYPNAQPARPRLTLIQGGLT